MSRCGSLMANSLSDIVPAHGVSGGVAALFAADCQPRRSPASDAAEAVDLRLEPGPLVPVADAEAFGGGQAQDADLALVGVVLHVAGGLADVVHGVGPGQRGVDEALVDEPVGLPRLLVVGEVR